MFRPEFGEPWTTKPGPGPGPDRMMPDDFDYIDRDGDIVGAYNKENAERIIACVNLLARVDLDHLTDVQKLAIAALRDVAAGHALADALQEMGVMPQISWKPIDEAPRELGKKFIMLLSYGKILTGMWGEMPREPGLVVECDWVECAYPHCRIQPTHWIPVPPVPIIDQL